MNEAKAMRIGRAYQTMRGFLLFLASGAALGACTPGPVAAPAAPAGGPTLAHCEEERQDADVRSFHCGGLTAVETTLLSATDHDVGVAFDQFAAAFSGPSTRRVDSVYTAGAERQTWMRLERATPRGALEAQMVAVATGGGVRLVTCSTRDPKVQCGPVVSSLGHGIARVTPLTQ